MKLTIAYIGFGKSTNRYHLPYTLIREHIQVKSIYDVVRKPELEADYHQYGIQFTDQLEDILDDSEIQLAVICTPPKFHYELACKCLESGKNVLVEKPFCSSVAETEALLQLAKEKNLTVMPFQNRRFDSDFMTLKQVIESGVLGELVEVESHFDYYRADSPTVAEAPVYDGAFYGLGVHTLDQMISLFGTPDAVSYDIRYLRNKANPDDTFEASLFYGDLKAIVKTSHLVAIPYPKFIAHGTKGSFVKYGIDQQETCLKAGIMPGVAEFGVDPEEHYAEVVYYNETGDEIHEVIPTLLGDYGKVYDSLYETIVHGAPKLVSDEEVLTNMTILEQGFKQKSPATVWMQSGDEA